MTDPKKARSLLAVIEILAAIQLRNRFIWLTLILAFYLLGHLTLIQLYYEIFDTFRLMANLLVVVEVALLIIALLLALSTPKLRQVWEGRFQDSPFSYAASGFVGALNTILLLVVMLVPISIVHRYPELIALNINVPLMLLQRSLLFTCVILVIINLIYILRAYVPLLWFLCGIVGIAVYIAVGITVTYVSSYKESFAALNDVFFYNELWRYINGFPRMETAKESILIPLSQYVPSLLSGLGVWLVTYLLWIPRTSVLEARDTSGSANSSSNHQ